MLRALFRKITSATLLFVLLCPYTGAANLSVVIGGTHGDYKKDVIGLLSRTNGFYEVGDHQATITLPDGAKLRTTSNQTGVFTDDTVITHVHVRWRPTDTRDSGIASISAFMKKNPFLADGWAKTLASWQKELKDRSTYEFVVAGSYKVEVRLAKEFKAWLVVLEVKGAKEFLAERIMEHTAPFTEAPHMSFSLKEHNWREIIFAHRSSQLLCSDRRRVRFFDLDTGKPSGQLELAFHPDDLMLSPDDSRLAVWDNTQLEIWDLTKGKRVTALKGGFLACTPDLTRGVQRKSNGLAIVDLADGATMVTLPDEVKDYRVKTVSPNGRSAVLNQTFAKTYVYDLGRGEPICELIGIAPPMVDEFVFTADSRKLIGTGHMASGWVYSWDALTCEQVGKFKAISHSGLAASADGKIVAGSSVAAFWGVDEIRLYDPSGKTLHELGKFRNSPARLQFSPNGVWFAASMGGGTDVYVWRLSELEK